MNIENTAWLGLSFHEICQQANCLKTSGSPSGQAGEKVVSEGVIHFGSMVHVPALHMVFEFKYQRCINAWHLPALKQSTARNHNFVLHRATL